MITQKYPFTEEDLCRAYEEWGANCGPTSLAVCLGKTLDEIRPAMDAVGFPSKRYTSPTMMERAIELAGGRISNKVRDTSNCRWADHGLVRIQWHGPWTLPGANPKWAYWHTHWIHSHMEDGIQWIFDCNGGWSPLEEWERRIVPAIVATISRADGKFSPTHVWQVVTNG